MPTVFDSEDQDMQMRSDLWEAVALSIAAENKKIDIFIHHNLSRGIAREALLRSIIVQHTPHPFEVHSGFVYTDDPKVSPAKQCDVLVYNPSKYRPYYQIDEFVVVHPNAINGMVEVKSDINDREFEKIRAMTKYAYQVRKPLFAFVYGGWTIDTFAEKILPFAKEVYALPFCLVVHDRNYLATFALRGKEEVYLLIDFEGSAGMATAFFMNIFDTIIREHTLPPSIVWDWFANRLTIVEPSKKRWLGADGAIHSCADP
jgi:hypothetical protein